VEMMRDISPATNQLDSSNREKKECVLAMLHCTSFPFHIVAVVLMYIICCPS
jgi:hypothetical protein